MKAMIGTELADALARKGVAVEGVVRDSCGEIVRLVNGLSVRITPWSNHGFYFMFYVDAENPFRLSPKGSSDDIDNIVTQITGWEKTQRGLVGLYEKGDERIVKYCQTWPQEARVVCPFALRRHLEKVKAAPAGA